MKSNNMFLNANLLIAGIILIGGVLLLLPQNGVMAWIESGSVDTITDDMASVNMVFSDGITSSVEGINHSVTSSSEQLVVIINNTGVSARRSLFGAFGYIADHVFAG